jgi:hypothetical protein
MSDLPLLLNIARALERLFKKVGPLLLLMLLLPVFTACGSSSSPARVPYQGVPVLAPSLNDSDFTIELRFLDTQLSPAQRDLTVVAALPWAQAISRDIGDVELDLPPGTCLPFSDALTQTIDDLLIDIAVGPLDGSGGILALAGPCVLRSGSLLPVYGAILLDIEDLSALDTTELFRLVFQHEMGHVLGLGTLWEPLSLVRFPGSSDPRYLGSQANTQYQSLGGRDLIPLEDAGGRSTQSMHWREARFGNELMTGILNLALPNPLSVLSLAALQDLGYRINLEIAEDYTLPGNVTSLLFPGEGFAFTEGQWQHELLVVTSEGEWVTTLNSSAAIDK